MSGAPKFTPGPWHVCTFTANDRGMLPEDALAIGPESVPFGTQCDAVAVISPISRITDADLANAQLIAAAPDLYAALRGLVNVLLASGAQSGALDSGVRALVKADGE